MQVQISWIGQPTIGPSMSVLAAAVVSSFSDDDTMVWRHIIMALTTKVSMLLVMMMMMMLMMLMLMVMMMTKAVTVAFCCSCGISQYTSCRWATGSHTTSVYKIIFLLFYFVCYFGFVLSFIFCFAFLGFVLIPLVWSTISLCNFHVPTFEYFIASSVTTLYSCCIFYKTHTWSTVIRKIAQMGYIQRNTFLRHSW